MFFDRNEIHIQAFVDFINGKLISDHSSCSTFHDFTILSLYKIKNKKLTEVRNSKQWTPEVSEISKILKFSDFIISNSPNKDASQRRGSYLLSIVIPLRSGIAGGQPRYLSPGT